jgi:hypothetical protein
MEDRLLANDRYVHRFTAQLRGLKPSTTYEYSVGSPAENAWSDGAEFTTAPDGKEPFSFIFMGDTHRSPVWGELLTKAQQRHPEAAFYMIGGDLVSTGLYRDDWDQLFQYSAGVFARRPMVPALGNHDDQDGLGAWMYLSMFGLPRNGPDGLEPERAYSFEYGNALFIILDATGPIDVQAKWLDGLLARSDATWKFAMFHFPVYSFREDYVEIRRDWGRLFDKYHLDMAFQGHVHYYLRTHPMKDEKPIGSPADGTIYVVSIAIPGRSHPMPKADYSAVAFSGEALYQLLDVAGNRLEYRVFDAEGKVRDKMVIEK